MLCVCVGELESDTGGAVLAPTPKSGAAGTPAIMVAGAPGAPLCTAVHSVHRLPLKAVLRVHRWGVPTGHRFFSEAVAQAHRQRFTPSTVSRLGRLAPPPQLVRRRVTLAPDRLITALSRSRCRARSCAGCTTYTPMRPPHTRRDGTDSSGTLRCYQWHRAREQRRAFLIRHGEATAS